MKGDKWISLAKIGTGLTDEEFKTLKTKLDGVELKKKPENYDVAGTLEADVWVEPRVVVEVAADEVTKSSVHATKATRSASIARFLFILFLLHKSNPFKIIESSWKNQC